MNDKEREEQYQYIWSYISNGMKNKNNVKYVKSEIISPYFEINSDEINENLSQNQEIKEVKINPFLRFSHIYDFLLDPNYLSITEDRKLREALFNVTIHLLANLDLYESRTKKDIYCNEIVKELKEGVFGKDISKKIDKISKKEQLKIAELIFNNYENTSTIESFEKGILQIFKDSVVFNMKYSDKLIPVYISEKKTEKNKIKFEILKELFLPIGLKIRVYWEIPFIIIGNEETMKIGKCTVF